VRTSKNATHRGSHMRQGIPARSSARAGFDHNPLSVTATSAWSPGSPVTVSSSCAASVTSLGVTLFSDNLTTTRTARVLN
jgi:hypothetical protein